MRHLILAAAALASTPALAVDVLIIHGTTNNATYHQDVQAYLVGSGLFGAVDLWSGDVSTPTLGNLAQYDAVLLMSDTPWVDATLMGDRLAGYVDNGGGVVDSIFSYTQHTAGLFRDRAYSPITAYSAYGTALTLGVIAAGSPLMSGVSTFADFTFHDDDAQVTPGATSIAAYSNGAALEAAWVPSGAGTVVALNFYPPSSRLRADFWDFNTDGERIVANALLGAASGGLPATFNTQASGSCPGAASLTVHNATANGNVVVVSGTAGASTIPAGVCAGTALPIANPRVRAQGVANSVGAYGLPIPALGRAACGARYVVVDMTTCAVAGSTLP
jgi:hypothetical protein